MSLKAYPALQPSDTHGWTILVLELALGVWHSFQQMDPWQVPFHNQNGNRIFPLYERRTIYKQANFTTD
jgi:hypothetical protein